MKKDVMNIAEEVADGLRDGRPIVALESTVITHGLPSPMNFGTALAMEAAVRKHGAIPATIAILDGVIHVGLTDGMLERLATLPADSVRKCSRRDLPIVVARGEHGATTVAGTMIVAQLAGIEVFATGGIGGVHRAPDGNGGKTFDVSADLREMGRTAVTIVSSGAKSILDLPATREVLETEGVTVLGWQTEAFPAFYYRTSGLFVDQRVESAEEAVAIIRARRELGYESATLVAVPVPKAAALDPVITESAMVQALREVEEKGISGAESTPYLLKRLVELTDGATLGANVALLENNAAVAAQIATAQTI